jgi:site-specific recombinase XerD
MPLLRNRSNIAYAFRVACDVWKQGIGESRKAVEDANNKKSIYTHSFSTFNRYAGITKEFVNFCKAQGVNRIDKLSYEIAKAFINTKIERDLKERTIKVNLCAVEKFFDVIGKQDISKELRTNYQDFYSQGRAGGRALAFDNAERVIEKIYQKNEAHGVMAELQYHTGARLGDLKKISIDTEGKKVLIQGSKGGRDRVLDFSDRIEKFGRIAELKERFDDIMKETPWKELRETYHDNIKYACKTSKEQYTGSHAFRTTYAVERFKELSDRFFKAYPEKLEKDINRMADSIITQELGHNRLSMSAYYRRG